MLSGNQYRLNPQTRFDSNVSTLAVAGSVFSFDLSDDDEKVHYITGITISGRVTSTAANPMVLVTLREQGTSGPIIARALVNGTTDTNLTIIPGFPIQLGKNRLSIELGNAQTAATDGLVLNIYGFYE